ncbi:MAG: Cro/C1-type DNA-binding domain [Clostridia bacterium]|nr:Cro/C1-type DNA-binding domain [Clostridia bacterium]
MKLKISEIRMRRHWNQSRLAKESGIARSYISELERGLYDPNLKTICKLCKALGCTPNDLIDCDECED